MSMAFAATVSVRPPRETGRLVRRCVLAALLPLLGLLSACPGESERSATGAAAHDTALLQELEHLERTGRARPASHEPALRALQERTAPASLDRIEVLGLRGLMAAFALDRTVVEQVSQQLGDWPDAATRL